MPAFGALATWLVILRILLLEKWETFRGVGQEYHFSSANEGGTDWSGSG
jgi:hypothetical protein